MKNFNFTVIFFIVFTLNSFNYAQNDPKCGTNGPVQSKIVGGVEATPYEYDKRFFYLLFILIITFFYNKVALGCFFGLFN